MSASTPASSPAAPSGGGKRKLNGKGYLALGLAGALGLGTVMTVHQDHKDAGPHDEPIPRTEQSNGVRECSSAEKIKIQEAHDVSDALFVQNAKVQTALGPNRGRLDDPDKELCVSGAQAADAWTKDGSAFIYAPNFFKDSSHHGDAKRAADLLTLEACEAGLASKTCDVGGTISVNAAQKGGDKLPSEIKKIWKVTNEEGPK